MWAIQVPSVRIGRSCCPCEPEEKTKTDNRDRSNQAKAYTHILGPLCCFCAHGIFGSTRQGIGPVHSVGQNDITSLLKRRFGLLWICGSAFRNLANTKDAEADQPS